MAVSVPPLLSLFIFYNVSLSLCSPTLSDSLLLCSILPCIFTPSTWHCDLFYTPASTCFQSLFQHCCHPLSPLSPLLLRLSHPLLITIDWLLKVTPSKDLGGCWCTTGTTVTAINLSFDVELRHCVCLSVCVWVGGCSKGQRWIYNAKRLIVCALHSWKSNIITKKRTKMRNVTAIFHFQCWIFLGQDSFFCPMLDSRVLMCLCVFSENVRLKFND